VPSAVSFGIVFGEADPPFAKRAKVERVVLNALLKADAALPPDCQCAGRSPRISSAPDTDRFERATLRRSVSDEGGEFHLARYQTLCFKLSFEHQRSRVAPDVTDWKFDSARKCDGVSVPLSPLCRRSLGAPQKFDQRIQQQQSAASMF
jgi:hypothetical protein